MSTWSEQNKVLIMAVGNGGFSLPVCYENIIAEKKDPHIRMFNLPILNEYASLGTTGCNRVRGILQLNVCYKSNSGTTELFDKVDEICAYFYPTRVFSGDTINVRLDNAFVGPILNDNGWCIAPISIDYFYYYARG